MSARARVALDLMLKQGIVTTVELKNMGYNHPPRVLADLKDAGVPFQMTRVRVEGEPRAVAGYQLIDNMNATGEAARRPIPKWFKDQLLEAWDYHCAICNGQYTARILQPDHRIPFRIGGDPDEWDEAFFMPLCGSDNRAKSWSCETCPNWEVRDPSTCATCYWASPDDYEHVATVQERRVSFVLRDAAAIDAHDAMVQRAEREDVPLPELLSDLFPNLAEG